MKKYIFMAIALMSRPTAEILEHSSHQITEINRLRIAENEAHQRLKAAEEWFVLKGDPIDPELQKSYIKAEDELFEALKKLTSED